MNTDNAFVVRHHRLVRTGEYLAGTRLICLINRQIVGTQHHILRRYGNRLAVLRLQEVICRQHKQSCLCLRLRRQGDMDSHLVAVKVRIERSTYQRVQTNGATLYQLWLKRLNTQTVQGRRTVQHDWVSLDDIFQHVPNLGLCPLDHLLC